MLLLLLRFECKLANEGECRSVFEEPPEEVSVMNGALGLRADVLFAEPVSL